MIVPKRQRGLGEVDEIVLSLYAPETISRITDTIIEEMQTWVARPLDEIYARSSSMRSWSKSVTASREPTDLGLLTST